ncbi:type II toxin-antitoxin system RelE/ParE family toxin [Methylolobus aquaticus]
MSEVVWLPEALDDVARLRGFLQEQSPIAAKRAAQALLEGANLLADHPDWAARWATARKGGNCSGPSAQVAMCCAT